jgi:hypothetical protein
MNAGDQKYNSAPTIEEEMKNHQQGMISIN